MQGCRPRGWHPQFLVNQLTLSQPPPYRHSQIFRPSYDPCMYLHFHKKFMKYEFILKKKRKKNLVKMQVKNNNALSEIISPHYVGLLEIQQAYESSHVWAYRVVKYCPINCTQGNMLLLGHILTPNNRLKSILIFVSKYVFSRGIFYQF